MLGYAIYKHFIELKEYKLFGLSRQNNFNLRGVEMCYGDLTDKEFFNSLFIKKFHSIIHCAAEVNVSFCQQNRDIAYSLNVEATKNLFSNLNADKFIYISTDAVFDGESGNYFENSTCKPLNFYAETKMISENFIIDSYNNYYIIRTNIYGFNEPIKNSLFEWAYKELNNNKNINGFSNMFFNPLYVGQLAVCIEKIVAQNIPFGIYNLTANEQFSKYKFLVSIAEIFNFSNILINEVKIVSNEFDAPRPLNTTLNNFKIKNNLSGINLSLFNGLSMLKNDFKKFINEKN